MAANTVPIFTDTPLHLVGALSAANTNRDGTGTIVTVYTPGADGGRIEMIRVQAIGTTTAGVIRVYIHDGTTAQLIKEILVTAITPSTSVEAWSGEWVPTVPILLPTTHSLRASTHNAENFKVHVDASDF